MTLHHLEKEIAQAASSLDLLSVAILRLLWSYGARNTRQIHSHLNQHRSLTYSDVMSEVSKLVGMGLLSPVVPDRGLSYSYAPTISSHEFQLQMAPFLREDLRRRLAPPLKERTVGA